jgi:hypothetical protein
VIVTANGSISLSPALAANSIFPTSAQTENAPASRFTSLNNAQIGITISPSLFHQIAQLAPKARLVISLGRRLGVRLITATAKFLPVTHSDVLPNRALLKPTTVSAGTPLFLMEGPEEAITPAPMAVLVEDQAQARTEVQVEVQVEAPVKIPVAAAAVVQTEVPALVPKETQRVLAPLVRKVLTPALSLLLVVLSSRPLVYFLFLPDF